MKNLAVALVDKERIHTTEAKASQLREFVEPLVTRAKEGDLHSRRLVFSRLGQKEAVHKLFTEIAPRVATRAGGYLRITKDARREGDGAPMAYIEFVDAAPKSNDSTEKPSAEKALKQKLHQRRKEMAKARR